MFGMVLNTPLSDYDSLCYYNTDNNMSLHSSEIQVKYKMDSISQQQPPEVLCKKRCSQKFHNIHSKTPAPDLFFNKVAGLGLKLYLKKRLWHRRFPVNFAKFLRTPFLQNTFGQLLQNAHAKILITHILYRRTTPEAYLEPSRTSTMELF